MPPVAADAGQGRARAARRRRAALRAQVGRLPLHRVPRRRRGRAGQPQRAAAHPLLPRAASSRCAPRCPTRCVVDGEIVVARADGLDFDALQQRIHPAESRVKQLAAETPASFVAFDLLALGDRDLHDAPFARAAARRSRGVWPTRRRRSTSRRRPTDRAVAADWFARFEGAGLDGVIAKPLDGAYQPDKRVMLKVKHERTADCVVAGFRWHKDGDGVGSLLLGLYDDEGTLHHVGVAASFTAARRTELVDELAPLARTRSTTTRGGLGRRRRRSARAGRHARGDEPVERRQGPVVGAAAPRAGRRGRATSTCRAAGSATAPGSALAARPRPGVVHLRPARRGRPRQS